jgi:hypothetical protein
MHNQQDLSSSGFVRGVALASVLHDMTVFSQMFTRFAAGEIILLTYVEVLIAFFGSG